MTMGHQKNRRRKISANGVTVGRRGISDVQLRRDNNEDRTIETSGFVQTQEENKAFREEKFGLFDPSMDLTADDDSYITTVSCLQLSAPEDSGRYCTAESSLENIDPCKAKASSRSSENGAEKILPNASFQDLRPSAAKRPSELSVAKENRTEIDKLIAYVFFLLSKRRHFPTDMNSNLVDREPSTFKKFFHMFHSSHAPNPEKEKKAGLFDNIFSRSDPRRRTLAKRDTMPFGLLLNAVSCAVETEGGVADNYEAAKKLLLGDTSDDVIKSDGLISFFDAFLLSFYSVKGHPEKEAAFRMLLGNVGSLKPDVVTLKRATTVLSSGNLEVGTQTDIEHRKYQQRGRGANKDRLTVAEMKRNSRRTRLASSEAADSVLSESETSSVRCDDLQDAPLPKAIVKPRSVSRHRKLCAKLQLSAVDSSQTSFDSSLVTSDSVLSSNSASDSGLSSSSFHTAPIPCMTSTPLKSPPPPPPLPPPSFLSSPTSCFRPNSLFPPVVKNSCVYKKSRVTNTIHWEAVKPDVTFNKMTVWSSQNSSESNFSKEQRERLERVFERVQKPGQDLQTRLGSKAQSPVVQLLNEKRALSLGIVLARFRPITVQQLVEMLESQSVDNLDADTLGTLLKHFPSEDELSLFKKYSSPEMLKDAELFCYLAARRPILKLRIELKVITEFLKTDLTRQMDCVNLLQTACDKMNDDPNVNTFLHRCLQYGNFLNQSTFAANASGFKLNSLLDTLRAKGTCGSTRLVDILAETAEPSLQNVVEHIDALKAARGNTVEELEKSVGSSQLKVKNAMQNLQECGDSNLCTYYSPLLRDSIKKYDQLVDSLKKIRVKEKKLQEFYCTPTMPLEKILAALQDSIALFQEAITMVKEREQRRARQIKNRSETVGKELISMPSKRFRKNYLESPNVKDLVNILDTTDV